MYTQQSKIGPRPAHGDMVKVLTIRHAPDCGRSTGYEECTCRPQVVQSADDTTQALGLSNSENEVK